MCMPKIQNMEDACKKYSLPFLSYKSTSSSSKNRDQHAQNE
jgi:hypothetical protein